MVDTPVCYFDLKTGILCPKCEAKLKRGEISELDVKVAQILVDLESKLHALHQVSFFKAIEAGDSVLVLMRKGDLAKLKPVLNELRRSLSERVGKSTIIAEKHSDMRAFFEDLLSPIQVVGMNTIWIPDGSREVHLILRGTRRSMKLSEETLRSVAEKLYGATLRISFEKPLRRVRARKLRRTG